MGKVLENLCFEIQCDAGELLKKCEETQDSLTSFKLLQYNLEDMADMQVGMAGSFKMALMTHRTKVDQVIDAIALTRLCHRRSYGGTEDTAASGLSSDLLVGSVNHLGQQCLGQVEETPTKKRLMSAGTKHGDGGLQPKVPSFDIVDLNEPANKSRVHLVAVPELDELLNTSADILTFKRHDFGEFSPNACPDSSTKTALKLEHQVNLTPAAGVKRTLPDTKNGINDSQSEKATGGARKRRRKRKTQPETSQKKLKQERVTIYDETCRYKESDPEDTNRLYTDDTPEGARVVRFASGAGSVVWFTPGVRLVTDKMVADALIDCRRLGKTLAERPYHFFTSITKNIASRLPKPCLFGDKPKSQIVASSRSLDQLVNSQPPPFDEIIQHAHRSFMAHDPENLVLFKSLVRNVFVRINRAKRNQLYYNTYKNTPDSNHTRVKLYRCLKR